MTAEMQRCVPARASDAIMLSFAAARSAERGDTAACNGTNSCICVHACVLIAVRIKSEISPSLCTRAHCSRRELPPRTRGKESMLNAMRYCACACDTYLFRYLRVAFSSVFPQRRLLARTLLNWHVLFHETRIMYEEKSKTTKRARESSRISESAQQAIIARAARSCC